MTVYTTMQRQQPVQKKVGRPMTHAHAVIIRLTKKPLQKDTAREMQKRKRKLLQPVLQMAAMTRLYIVLSAKLKSAERAKPLRLQDTVLVHGQL